MPIRKRLAVLPEPKAMVAIKCWSAYNTLERKFQLFQFRPLELLRICSIIKLEDSGVDQLSVAMMQWTGSVSADCGARPWVEREPQAE